MPTGRQREFLTTSYLPHRETWAARCEMIDLDALTRPSLIRHLIRGARTHQAVILDGSDGPRALYVELLAAIAIRRGLGGTATPIVLKECQWKLGGSRLDRLATRLGLRILDGPKVAYCVLSDWERERFTKTWGIDPDRVFLTPYCYTLSEAELAVPTSTRGGIFAGGDSLRDYGPLLTVAPELDERVSLATKTLNRPLPANVTAEPASHKRFIELLCNARIVVVPLTDRDDRTAGQQTYLNAMALGKPLIVTDSPGVREYVDAGRTGIIIPPRDPQALRQALSWLLDPANATVIKRMTTEAAHTARTRFSPERFLQATLDVADRMA